MHKIYRILEQAHYTNAAFIAQQEKEIMLQIAAFIAPHDIQEADHHRLTRHAVTGEPGTYIIFWDGRRKGILYSGLQLEEHPNEKQIRCG